ncbi:MAG: class I SAM-dependent RNA methyltransferase [Rickettsiaceae bacterium]|nr:class I SAM-dependent RNA methyltransferase [Rickettsiaceae bacterium]
MTLIEKGICKILRLNEAGLGSSKTDRGNIELPYTLPGEIVEFERHSYRSQKNSILKDIIEESPDRIKPKCKYYGSCGGCNLQHINENLYKKFKLDLISSALSKYNIDTTIKDIITPTSGRRRASLKAIRKGNKILLGFLRFQSNQIINIEECCALSEKLSKSIPPLKEALNKILKEKQKSVVYITEAMNGVDILIESNDNLETNITKEDLPEYVIRLRLNDSEVFAKDAPYVEFSEVKVGIDNKSFLQATLESDKILAKIITEHAPKNGKGVDLFSGSGTLTIPLAQLGLQMDAFESDKDAIAALSDASPNNIYITKRDLYDDPLSSDELSIYNFAIINPPRMGAKKQISELAKSNISRIIYVSCNPSTFARDASILISGGYSLLEVTPLDQFLYTNHLEVIGVFERQ